MKIKKKLTLASFLVLLLLPASLFAWQGRVVGISDGDTLSVMREGKAVTIRLYGVDSPESRQDFGSRAKQFTSSLVFGKTVDVRPIDHDRHGRVVGLITIDEKTINEELIRAGMAWVYSKYCKEPFCAVWSRLQEEARQNKIGLWSTPNPLPPWEFRHRAVKKSVSLQLKNKGDQVKLTGQKLNTDQAGIEYRGNTASRVFHKRNCRFFQCKQCTATFTTREDALKAGYLPCRVCNP